MTTPDYSMSGEEYLAHLKRLRFAQTELESDEGISAAARFFGAAPRTGRDWPKNGPPNGVAIALRLMDALKLDAAAAAKLLEKQVRRRR